MLEFLFSSFRDAPLGAGPESITTIVSMDSGLALRAPRNDDVNIASYPTSFNDASTILRWSAVSAACGGTGSPTA